MDAPLEKIKQVQKDAWNKSSAGWKKWDEMTMHFMKPVGDAMIRQMQLNPNDQVLDVATGTGEPGLTIASIIKQGKVIGMDLSEEMLLVAEENARNRNLANFETVCCDVSELPFADSTFDGVSCRFGFMFFPDMMMAMREMVRVLKPGGRLSAAVWNAAEKNFWISASMSTMISRLQLNPPQPGSPGLFRCCGEGDMEKLYRNAGLRNIIAEDVTGKLPCGTHDIYWSFISEVASPAAFAKADETLRQEIREEVLEKIRQRYPSGNLAIDSSALVICGTK